jgi:hypothetical protein
VKRLRDHLRRRGIVGIGFEMLLVVQVLHLGEHAIQMVQLYAAHLPPAQARGLISPLDVEKVHFFWNLFVLGMVGWVLTTPMRTGWLVAMATWALLHTAEHGFLLVRALASGLEGQPGILGDGGWLAQHGWQLVGLTTWSRATVHFAWNLGEVILLALALRAALRLRFVDADSGRLSSPPSRAKRQALPSAQ